ncbi:MAG: hypothetical protein AAB367_01360 [Patescibacteria group bacterium]
MRQGNRGNSRGRSNPPQLTVDLKVDFEKVGDEVHVTLSALVHQGKELVSGTSVQFFTRGTKVGSPKVTDPQGRAKAVYAYSGDCIAEVQIVDKAVCDSEPVRLPDEFKSKRAKLPNQIHVSPAGRGRVFVSVAVLAQDDAPINGAAVNIFEAGESRDPKVIKRSIPLETLTTNERGALDPVPYFDVALMQGKRRLFVHVAGTKLQAFVTCRASSIRPPKAPADLPRVAAAFRRKLFGTRSIRAFLHGIRMGGEALREQRKGGSK